MHRPEGSGRVKKRIRGERIGYSVRGALET